MLALLLKLALVAALAWGWRMRAAPVEPAALRRRLVAALALALALLGTFSLVRALPAGGAHLAGQLASCAIAVALFALLARIALSEPFARADAIYRMIASGIGVFLLLVSSPAPASVFFMLALTRFPWLKALRTGERLMASVTCLALTILILAGRASVHGLSGVANAAQSAARVVAAVALVYAMFGVDRAFRAFTSDPTLGVRRVSKRLALSHVLVVVVPLVLLAVLWISSTYLGVNADRALIAARGLDREAQRLEESMRVALAARSDAAASARALAAARLPKWPGTRAFVVRDTVVERVAGLPLPDGAAAGPLAQWCARLDSLPSHGVVELHARRWLGAAARDPATRIGLVMLAPIREPLDSTLSPMLGGEVRIAPMADERVLTDSLRRELGRLADVPASRSAAARDSVALARARAVGRRLGIPESLIRSERPDRRAPVVVSSGSDTLRLASGEIGLTGQAVVRGVTHDGRQWKTDEFMLTARASFHSTIAGLYANLNENPLKVIPLLVLAGLAILLVPIGFIDIRMVGGMGHSITRGIGALREGAAAFGTGTLTHRIPIEGDDDLWDTARQFNRMAEGLERARELEKERDRLENELELARRIQARLLPAHAPRIAGLDIAGVSESAREVGGDYYDHIDQGGGRVLLVVADVSGKGVPAALLMSGFRAALMSQDASLAEPARVARRLNEFLLKSVEPGRFVTAFLGQLDSGSGRLDYVNAGHNPPVLVRRGGAVEFLATDGMILGVMPDAEFAAGHTTLAPGELLALYTDGVTEGADASQTMWGEERLVALLQTTHGESAASVAFRIVKAVRAFEGESGPADDITILVARRTGDEPRISG